MDILNEKTKSILGGSSFSSTIDEQTLRKVDIDITKN
jgi:hypothetical protein